MLSYIFVIWIATLNCVFIEFIFLFASDWLTFSKTRSYIYFIDVYSYFNPHTKDFSWFNVFIFIFRCPSSQKSQIYKKKMLK